MLLWDMAEHLAAEGGLVAAYEETYGEIGIYPDPPQQLIAEPGARVRTR